MTLNHDQIERLHTFTQKAGVKYYDVQLELVDHLAAQIEAEMEADPALDFQEGLRKVYTTFGRAGFADIVKEKTKQVRRMGNVHFYNELKQFFTFPKILITLTVFLALLFIAPMLSNSNRFALIMATGSLIAAYHLYAALMGSKKKMKKVLLLDAWAPGGIWLVLGVSVYWVYSWADQLSKSTINPWLFAGLGVVTFIVQLACAQIYLRAVKRAEVQYPAAFS